MNEIIRALDQIGTYEELRDTLPQGNHDAFIRVRQVERAYEQLQEQGLNVSEQLRERRFQLLGAATKGLEFSSQGLEEYVHSRGKNLGDEPNIPDIVRCANFIKEYAQKLNVPNDLMKDTRYFSE